MAATKTPKTATPGRNRAGARGKLGRTRRQSHTPDRPARRFARPAGARTETKPTTGTDLVVYTPPVQRAPLGRKIADRAAL